MLEDTGDGTFSADIDGRRYTFAHYDADKAWRTMCELFATLGEGLHLQGLGEVAEGAGEQALYYGLAAKALLSGVGKDPERSLRLLKRLCCDNVQCEGKPLPQEVFKVHFRGDLLHATKVAAAALECQYSNFYKPLIKLVGLKKREKPSAPSDTTT